MSDIDKMILIRDLGEMLEQVIKGTETEYSKIYYIYLERIYKITKVFMNNIEKEVSELKLKNDDSDDEESFKKFNDNTNDVDSVSEYSDYDSNDEQVEINFKTNNDEDDENDKIKMYREALTEFDNVIRTIYNDIQTKNIITIKKID